LGGLCPSVANAIGASALHVFAPPCSPAARIRRPCVR